MIGNKKKALIIGGSNGIGLSIAEELHSLGYSIIVVDKKEPFNMDNIKGCEYKNTDLYYFDEELMNELSHDKSIEVLVITAGIGRIADFEFHHIAEIDKIITIDTTATIKTLKVFYNRIKSATTFYTCVMGSIAGWVSSPAASVYAAAKAGINRFLESVNIELEIANVENRILNVTPASFEGSRFYGKENDLSLLKPISKSIIDKLFKKESLYIPERNKELKKVIDRYNRNAHDFGIESYEYKKNSERFSNDKRVAIGYLSGTFDLFHVGHLNILKRAKEKCDYLIVGVHNNGEWKEKETFVPLDERKAIVASCKYVDKVVDACLEDSDAWNMWHYDKLFVGSDYKGTDRFINYEEFFKDKGVEVVYFPYTQGISSTKIRTKITKHEKN